MVKSFSEFVTEKFVIRVNAKGKRSRKIKCAKGKVVKHVNGRPTCVTQGGHDRMVKKLAVKKANRTKKAKGSGYRKRSNIKRQRAITRRHQMGL